MSGAHSFREQPFIAVDVLVEAHEYRGVAKAKTTATAKAATRAKTPVKAEAAEPKTARKAVKAQAAGAERFEGFADGEMRFFRALAKHQDRDWFAEHKGEYEEGWAKPMAALLSEVREAVDSAYPDCELGEPKVFRIYRDVRFGKDKSPFKTHVSGVITAKPRSKVTEAPAAFYLQLGTETFAGAGLYMMDARALTSFRTAVLDDERGGEVAGMLQKLEKKGFEASAAEELKSAPRGIDPDHPRIGLLKRKGLVVSFPTLPVELIESRKVLDWAIAQAKLSAPLVRWLVYNTV
ncbi:MAG: DUF2461 domain-containing protein [Polyangiaceae bacterium]|nr:DUF2461 domain-containing protein [Polyangiaceae bacterium]